MGQKFAAYDAQGNVTAFYDSVDSPLPAGASAIKISDAEWQAAISSPGYKVVPATSSGVLTAPPAPTAAQQLADAQAVQIGKMHTAYQAAISADVSFTTAGGVTKMFQADAEARDNAGKMLAAYKTAVPAGFYWVSSDNTQVPFTLADLQGLAKAMGDQGWAAFQRLQQRKATINAATTVAAVQAVVW